jgi:hypothetical protein
MVCKETPFKFEAFVAKALGKSVEEIRAELESRYDLKPVKQIEPNVIERYHYAIWSADNELLRRELYARAVLDEDILKYRLGVDNNRITIPIQDRSNRFVNVRKYKPGAPGPEKMQSVKGYNTKILFPIAQLDYDTIVLTGGECKAIVGARLLNPHNIGCISTIAGEGKWDNAEHTKHFAKKKVYIIYDIDDAGRKGAQSVAAYINAVASAVYIVDLPLDREVYPTGDLNDYVKLGKDLKILLDEAVKWEPTVVTNNKWEKTDPLEMNLVSVIESGVVGRRVQFPAVLLESAASPFLIPKVIIPTCQKDQVCCGLCTVFHSSLKEFQVPDESPSILEMIDAENKVHDKVLGEAIGVPRVCRAVTYEVTDHYSVIDGSLCSPAELSSTVNGDVQPCAIIQQTGADLKLNEPYKFVGRLQPHPKTQRATLMLSEYVPEKDSLSSFKLASPERLRLFRPTEWTIKALTEKLAERYEDLATNVTRIYGRPDMHLMVDLSFHSMLAFLWDGKEVKGNVEVVILGDSAQGKTETVTRLMKHYDNGTKIECKNMTVAGLMGACLQHNSGRWYIQWGKIPRNDRRLVFLEELKGTPTTIIGQLTDMRSSGIASIQKAASREISSRVRIIAVSNPRNNESVAELDYGINGIKELVGAPEDVRRFDAGMVVATNEVDDSLLYMLHNARPTVDHCYTQDLCRDSVLFAWTRKLDEVQFEEVAKELCVKNAKVMCSIFSGVIPLVDKGSQQLKIARLSASLAALTFSTDDEMNTVIVRECHVQYITEWLTKVYSSRRMGYLSYSKAKTAASTLEDPEEVKALLNSFDDASRFVSQLLSLATVSVNDFMATLDIDRTAAQAILSQLLNQRALISKDRKYAKTPAFIELLQETDWIVKRQAPPAFARRLNNLKEF